MQRLKKIEPVRRCAEGVAVVASLAFLYTPSHAQAAAGKGTGLTGNYFANTNLSGVPALTRIDPVITFQWGSGSPGTGLSGGNFAARWTGQIEAPVSGNYYFFTISDDGTRLTLDGSKLIDDWSDHSQVMDHSGAVSLTAGSRHSVQLDYYSHDSGATMQLYWMTPSGKLELVPQAYLYPDAAPTQPSLPALLTAPTVTASGAWVSYCPCCGGPMPVVTVNWSNVSGAVSYNLYRDGTKIATGLTTTSYKDMTTQSGSTYRYQVAAMDTYGREGALSASVPAYAPMPPVTSPSPTSGGEVPTNLRCQGLWLSALSTPSDILQWDPVPGAVSYNVYQYDAKIGSGIATSQFQVPPGLYLDGLNYTVTAVDATGMESLPSALTQANGAYNPAYPPSWTVAPPQAPANLTATGEWNAGAPRIRLTWTGTFSGATFTVYRDGQKVAEGLWDLVYFDNNVVPGESHTYAVTGVSYNFLTRMESAACPATQGVAPKAMPMSTEGKVQITGVIRNDDSAKISFAAVPGAVDYRIYNINTPTIRKYSGGALTVEMNGIDPAAGADVVVEALDKMGPFQKMDGEMGPGSTIGSGAMSGMSGMSGTSGTSIRMEVNGQGDPSNEPNIIAASDTTHIDCQPAALTGDQAFFDNFRNSQAFQQIVPMDPVISAANFNADPNDRDHQHLREYQNDHWTVRLYDADMDNTKVFFMSNHFMDTIYDGGTPRKSAPLHNNNASLVMSPKSTADISKGKVLHVTFEVDPHFSGRRWCEVWVTQAGDPIIHPGKFADTNEMPTPTGNVFRWQILGAFHCAQLFHGDGKGFVNMYDLFPNGTNLWGPASRDGSSNGTMGDLDRRHRFDLYISQTRVRLVEEGQVIKDDVFPAGSGLPFTNAQVSFVHQVYHTFNERGDMVNYAPSQSYWIGRRPWSDERHWDNMGFEVLNAFPNP